MTTMVLRAETRPDEHRTPVVPSDARRLVQAGVQMIVERSADRCWPIEAYADAGCVVAPAGAWHDAGMTDYVVGLKELPAAPGPLVARHVLFGHAYRGQPHARALLDRFVQGGGVLLDIESLVDCAGRRTVTFGYWAGYVGGALAVLRRRGVLPSPLAPMTRAELEHELYRKSSRQGGDIGATVVLGALGRAGRGAADALRVAAPELALWDLAETRALGPGSLSAFSTLVHVIGTSEPGPPMLRVADTGRGLVELVVDVTCDGGTPYDRLQLSDAPTGWDAPVRTLETGGELIAVDNLPSLLPAESSAEFSSRLLPHLLGLHRDGLSDPAWSHVVSRFRHESAIATSSPPSEAST